MEIAGFGQTPMITETAVGQSQATRLRALADGVGKNGENAEGLAKAAQEFEAVFLNQLLKSMRATVPENEFFNSNGPTKFYQQMYDAEMAKGLSTGHTGMGIADLIIQQFESTLTAEESVDGTTESIDPGPAVQPSQEGLRRYREVSLQQPGAGRMIHLRRMAEAQEPAVADTLRRFEGAIAGAARETGLDPELLLAVVMEESGGDPEAVSSKGAVGLMQLMPATAAEVGVRDPKHPAENIAGGARYLQKMMDRFGGDRELALAAYNAGPGNVNRAGGKVPDFPETRTYIDRVEARYQKLSGGTEMANRAR